MSTDHKWLVLVVEDDPDVRNLIQRALSKEYDVVAAADGATALARLQQSPLPALIVSDIMMPDMDGLEMGRRLKDDSRTAHVPIIFLTALGTPQNIVAGIKAGARLYITKPFRIPDLLDKVKQVLHPVAGKARRPGVAR
ncbi:MAG TPA: response regulator [Polyangiales bacterium]